MGLGWFRWDLDVLRGTWMTFLGLGCLLWDLVNLGGTWMTLLTKAKWPLIEKKKVKTDLTSADTSFWVTGARDCIIDVGVADVLVRLDAIR